MLIGCCVVVLSEKDESDGELLGLGGPGLACWCGVEVLRMFSGIRLLCDGQGGSAWMGRR